MICSESNYTKPVMVGEWPRLNPIFFLVDNSKTVCFIQHDYSNQMFHLWKGDWQQVGSLFGSSPGWIYWRRCLGCSGPETVLLPADVALPCWSHWKIAQLRTTWEIGISLCIVGWVFVYISSTPLSSHSNFFLLAKKDLSSWQLHRNNVVSFVKHFSFQKN